MPTRAHDVALATASGILLTLSFPKFGHPAVGWIALAPLLVALVPNRDSRIPSLPRSLPRAFALGLIAGIVYFTGTLYWITRVMIVYGGLHPASAVLVNAALVAYLALYPAVFAIVEARLLIAYGPGALLGAPAVWVATELGRTYLFTGFPWVLLGYSQAETLAVAQLASLAGVYAVSALVAAVSAGAALAAASRKRSDRVVAIAPVVFLLVTISIWGARRASSAEWTRAGEAIRVGLVQGNVDQAQKWDAQAAGNIFQDYLRMTREAIGRGAELVLWPESSTPFYFEEERPAAERIRAIARQAHVPILVGSDQIERGVPPKYYNSAFLVSTDGTTSGTYRKMHLVPFGEYVPLKHVFFFAAPLVEAVSDFSPGQDAALLPVDHHRVSTAICYEIVYPELVRRFVRSGSELLTTITNDAWFGSTSAPYQHFEQASMRAIEEGRYLVRSANTGISGIVDPYGRVVERSDIFQKTVLVGQARFLRVSTVYARIGDAFAYACAVVTGLMLVFARRRVQ